MIRGHLNESPCDFAGVVDGAGDGDTVVAGVVAAAAGVVWAGVTAGVEVGGFGVGVTAGVGEGEGDGAGVGDGEGVGVGDGTGAGGVTSPSKA
jgi:hypothetical protein